MDYGSNLRKRKTFFLLPNRADRMWAQSASYSLCTKCIFQEVTRPRRDYDHSSTSSARIRLNPVTLLHSPACLQVVGTLFLLSSPPTPACCIVYFLKLFPGNCWNVAPDYVSCFFHSVWICFTHLIPYISQHIRVCVTWCWISGMLRPKTLNLHGHVSSLALSSIEICNFSCQR